MTPTETWLQEPNLSSADTLQERNNGKFQITTNPPSTPRRGFMLNWIKFPIISCNFIQIPLVTCVQKSYNETV
mgnify:CR=1 FL=1